MFVKFHFFSLRESKRPITSLCVAICDLFQSARDHHHHIMIIQSRFLTLFALLCMTLVLVSFPGNVNCAKKAAAPAAPPPPAVHEPVIEEVTQKQLERLLQEKDYVAVYWCKCIQPMITHIHTLTHVRSYSSFWWLRLCLCIRVRRLVASAEWVKIYFHLFIE